MKRYGKWIVIAAVVAVLGTVAWAVIERRSAPPSSDKKTVITTFTVIADMARSVAGDRMHVESLTKPGAEIHGYEPTPQDMVRLQKADLVLDNGMNLEKWAEKLYQTVGDVRHETLSKNVTPIGIAEGPYKDTPNPHAWMSPKNALLYVDAIAGAFASVDAGNSSYYRKNADAYKKEITKVDELLRSELSSLPESNRYMVSCEGAFSYLIRDYDLKEAYLWPINADAQGTPQQIKKVVETVKKHKVPAVFCETTVSDKAQRQVASETGARFGGSFYVDSLSGSGGDAPTYLGMLEYNARTLIRGLKGE